MCNSTLNYGFAFSIHKFGSNPKAVDPTPSAEPLRPGFSWSRTGSDPRFVGLFLLAQFFSFFGIALCWMQARETCNLHQWDGGAQYCHREANGGILCYLAAIDVHQCIPMLSCHARLCSLLYGLVIKTGANFKLLQARIVLEFVEGSVEGISK